MADANVRAADPRNYQLSGKVSLWFRKNGSLVEADWVDLGNVINPELAPALTRLDHFSNRRGVRAKDKSLITERAASLNLSIDEINLPNLQFAFMSGAAAAGDSVEVNDDKIVLNPGTGQTIKIGVEDLTPGSLVVRNLNHEEEQTFAAGPDYTIDYALGIVTIVGGALADTSEATGNPEIHLHWSKNVETQSFEIFPGADVTGEAKLQILTDSGIQYVAHFKNVNMRNNGAIKIGDGSKYEEVSLQLEILEDGDGKLGTVHIVNADELP